MPKFCARIAQHYAKTALADYQELDIIRALRTWPEPEEDAKTICCWLATNPDYAPKSLSSFLTKIDDVHTWALRWEKTPQKRFAVV